MPSVSAIVDAGAPNADGVGFIRTIIKEVIIKMVSIITYNNNCKLVDNISYPIP